MHRARALELRGSVVIAGIRVVRQVRFERQPGLGRCARRRGLRMMVMPGDGRPQAVAARGAPRSSLVAGAEDGIDHWPGWIFPARARSLCWADRPACLCWP